MIRKRMFKIITIFIIFTNILVAESFNFSELRYNDAIGKTILLEGKIDFFKEGLKILYPKSAKSLEYKDDNLIYKEGEKEVVLGDMQSAQIMRYFDILILLHYGDDSSYEDMFEVTKKMDVTYLKPLGMIKNYVNNIETYKENARLKYVKLFLKNSDYITITIDD